jgi:hypothetical protein
MSWSNSGGNKSFRDRDVAWTCPICGRSFLSDPAKVDEAKDRHFKAIHFGKDYFASTPPRYPEPKESGVATIPERPSVFRRLGWKFRNLRFRRRSGYGSYSRRRIRKINVFLIIWIASFFAGFLLTSMNVFYMLFISLIDAFIVFIPLLILWWLWHKRTVGKIIAVFLVIVFAVYIYQYPSSFTKNSLKQDFFFSEGSAMSAISSSMNIGAAGGGNGPPIVTVSGKMISTSGSLTVLGSGLQVNFQAPNGTVYSATVDNSGDYSLQIPSGTTFTVFLTSPLLGSQIQLTVGNFNSGYSNTTYNITCQNNSPDLQDAATCSDG